MNFVKVKNVVIGEGKPKICVPIVGKTRVEIIDEAKSFASIPVDVVEWRVDWYEDVMNMDDVKVTLKELVEVLNGVPVLFTFRTQREGGEREISTDYYVELNKNVAETKLADLIDVEAFTGDDIVKDIIETAHKNNIKVVASNHDFDKTPTKDDIISRLIKMQKLGADIPKIAVMPQNKADVLVLLDATLTMYEKYADRPIITMSMSKEGVVSRLIGETFGSALTFGAAKKASAPGQIGVDDLSTVLNIINKSI